MRRQPESSVVTFLAFFVNTRVLRVSVSRWIQVAVFIGLGIAIKRIMKIWPKFTRSGSCDSKQITNILGFSFSWTISNFSACEFKELESPEVPYHTAKWYLVLRSSLVDGTPMLGLYIKVSGLRIPLEIKYQLSMVDVKNERVYNFVHRDTWNSVKAAWFSGTPKFINTEEINVQNGLLVNGSVTFLAQIVAVNPITENFVIPDFPDSLSPPVSPETITETRSEPQDSVNDLERDLRTLLKKEELSDLKLSIQGREFSAHKAIVAARCPSIASQILDGANEIVFDDMDPNVFSDVLTFIYTDNIDDESLTEKGEMVLKTAEILKLEKLKSRAEKVLLSSLNRLILAYECNCEQMKEPILQMMKQYKTEVQATPNWKLLKNYPEILLDLFTVI
uniref:Speckle-type POZ protein n=1 Tax=Lygus hesperus TaxID=30085 RepID=A0A0K8TH81_LYGHE